MVTVIVDLKNINEEHYLIFEQWEASSRNQNIRDTELTAKFQFKRCTYIYLIMAHWITNFREGDNPKPPQIQNKAVQNLL